MAATADDLKSRLLNARESLDTELKSWIDPASDTGKMVIAGTCMALRNNNGGFLIIGVRDDGKPDQRKLFADVRKTFHADVIQEIISRYSSERFEVVVHFVEREGMECVMIEVPAGVRTPVLCRSNIPKADVGGHKAGSLLSADTVYVRTLESNGRPSTSSAKLGDWPRLMEHCFDNREADIGAFMRRQLSGMDLNTTSSALLEILQAAKAPSATELMDEYLDECYRRYADLRGKHRPPVPKCGTRDAAGIILGDFTRPELTQQYMLRLGAGMHRHSGWSPWVSLMNAATERSGANVVRDGWESFIYDPSLFNILDFSRIEDLGKFYYLEGLRDDLTDRVQPGQFLEFAIETRRVTEIVAAALYFAKSFVGPDSTNDLIVGVRWKGLAGRRLGSWASDRGFVSAGTAHDDEKTTYVTLPIATAVNAIALHVEGLVKPLFRLFGGWEFDARVVRGIVESTLGNRS